MGLAHLAAGAASRKSAAVPGNAPAAFAQRGYHIRAIEMDERLAALAAARCRARPRVAIRPLASEDWQVEVGAFALAVSADTFGEAD